MTKKTFFSNLISFSFCIFLLFGYSFAKTKVESTGTEKPHVTKSTTVHRPRRVFPFAPPPPIPDSGNHPSKFPLTWPFTFPPSPGFKFPPIPPFAFPPSPGFKFPPIPPFAFPPIPPFAFPPLPGFKFPPIFPPFPGTPPNDGAKGDGSNKKN
ncbi:PREDICTED: vegetative cell wall protein gp1-like [Nicotiana attenuata]|uniref:vegetative cell wall protein gp1-like n=1 Tax=Nicotiana attenuata TaxID=49451 RepID=UPI000904725A|nr:PREDICTED: vegetative cell wall protein gp1-like [Nicotiana attenuata]